MKFTEIGGWTVSSPVYIGFGADVEKARECWHAYVEFARDMKEGHLMIAERCTMCVATRTKYKKIGE